MRLAHRHRRAGGHLRGYWHQDDLFLFYRALRKHVANYAMLKVPKFFAASTELYLAHIAVSTRRTWASQLAVPGHWTADLTVLMTFQPQHHK